jgi:ketosteroid isomerase-like protein
MSDIEKSKAAVLAFFEAMNQGDAAAIADSYTDDGYVWTMGNTLISGKNNKQQIREFAGQIYQAFPNGISFEVLHMTAEENRVAVEAISTGDHISGVVYSNKYHFLFHLRDGKVECLKEYMDTELVTDILCGGQRPPQG